MKTFSPRQKSIIILLILLFLASILLFIVTFQHLSKSGQLKMDFNFRNRSNHLERGNNQSMIRPWMTFDYVNVIYKLPPSYLEETFDIDDPRYPNIRIDNYIKHYNLSPFDFLTKLEQSITNYSSPN